MRNRILYLAVAAAMLTVLFAGCSTEQPAATTTAVTTTATTTATTTKAGNTATAKATAVTSATTAATTAATTTIAASGEPVELSWMVSSHPSYPYQKDWFAFRQMEEMFNVKLNVEAVDGDSYAEKLQIKMAGGNLCDVTSGLSRSDSIMYGAEGAFADLNGYMDLLPDFAAWIADDHQSFIDSFKPSEGSLYIFPLKGISEVDQASFYYRADIFEKNNLSVPTTYTELYDVSVQLHELYPASNPFSFRYNLYNINNMMGVQWNTGGVVYYDYDHDDFRCGYTTENYQAMIQWFNKMYADKLIPADFMSINTAGWEQLVTNDLTFMCSDNCLRIDTFNNQMKNTGFQLKYMTPPKGDVADGAALNAAAMDSSGFCVAANSKNLEAALRVLDQFYIEDIAHMLCYGEEGKTFKYVDNRERFINEAGEYIDIYGVCQLWGLHTVGTYAIIDPYSEVGACGATPECVEAYDLVKKDLRPYAGIVNFTADQSKTVSDLQTIIETYAQEAVAKFILGTEPLDHWDNFVAEVQKLGVDTLVGYYNDTYKK